VLRRKGQVEGMTINPTQPYIDMTLARREIDRERKRDPGERGGQRDRQK
jgi:hypothetical protein